VKCYNSVVGNTEQIHVRIESSLTFQ